MEKVLFAADELTGLIGAAALMRPSKSVKDMEVKSIKKKFKDKKFAAGCSREVIQQGAQMLGWDLNELMDKTLQAMQQSEKRGLNTTARPLLPWEKGPLSLSNCRRQGLAQGPALFQGTFIGIAAADHPLGDQLGSGLGAGLLPLAHPLTVSPAIGAEQPHRLPRQVRQAAGEQGFKFRLLQHLGPHGRASKPMASNAPPGQHPHRHWAAAPPPPPFPAPLCHRLGHGLGIAGAAQ